MIKIFSRVVFFNVIALLTAAFLSPLDENKLYKPASQSIYSREDKLLRVFLSSDDKWRIPVRIEEVSDELKKFVVQTEDKLFYLHPGVNPWAVLRAAYLNLKNRKIISGGSTITMQVARMMEHRERTVWAKVIETLKAIKLEMVYSKSEILEFYLNLAPYGGNIEGIGAACYYYFRKGPQQISTAQAALLTAIPNSPNDLRPDLNPDRAKLARNKVLKRLKDDKVINGEKLRESMNEAITMSETGMPFLSPHFTDYIQKICDDRRVYTTLDLKIQNKLERVIKNHIVKLRKIGITNASAVVIDNNNHSLLAMVGSFNFLDSLNSGQVNGALSPRSPGSTLKPLLYADGIDRGYITPRTCLFDVPVEYGGYTPENYDSRYRGMVSVEDALRYSMNVPAINLLARIRPENFMHLLKKGGMSTIKSRERDYGLSLILGGCEVKLVELANFYSILANGGVYNKLKMIEEDTSFHTERVFSRAASFIISETLSRVRRPDLPEYWKYTSDMPKVAWKTGTSYGHRDAWSVGYTRNYTVGVWCGNFDGRGVPELVGSKIAGPILFDILLAFINEEDRLWFEKPSSVRKREVCEISGKIPNEYCEHTVEEYYIPGVSSEERCEIHRAYPIDEETGFRLTRKHLSGKEYREKVFEVYPPEVATWMERNGFPVEQVPEMHPDIKLSASGKGPVIKSPQDDMSYLIRRGIPMEYQKIPLDASVDNSVRELYWFMDGELVYSGKPEKMGFLEPEKGKHKLVCQDDRGRSSTVTIFVR